MIYTELGADVSPVSTEICVATVDAVGNVFTAQHCLDKLWLQRTRVIGIERACDQMHEDGALVTSATDLGGDVAVLNMGTDGPGRVLPAARRQHLGVPAQRCAPGAKAPPPRRDDGQHLSRSPMPG